MIAKLLMLRIPYIWHCLGKKKGPRHNNRGKNFGDWYVAKSGLFFFSQWQLDIHFLSGFLLLVNGLVLHWLLESNHQWLDRVLHPLTVVIDEGDPNQNDDNDQQDQQDVGKGRWPGGRGTRHCYGGGSTLQAFHIGDLLTTVVLGEAVVTTKLLLEKIE